VGELTRLIGDILFCASFLTYCGSFTQEIRDEFLQNVMQSAVAFQLLATTDFKVFPFLASEGAIGESNLQGLPTDNTSIQNGVIVSNTWLGLSQTQYAEDRRIAK
jgi:dynein heavy chain